jgi:alpha-methylacyl-CoA racemase
MGDHENDPGRPPLHGLRVLDLTRLLPGPYAGHLLAELGADVIKVEEPEQGDGARLAPPFAGNRSILFEAINAGKRSIALDLKHPAGHEAFLRLVDGADILLEGFRPGTLDRLGLGYDTLRERNSRLIVCAITGYGQQGPYRLRAGHDLNYMGYAGMLALLACPGAAPHAPGLQLADVAGGAMSAVIGVLAALVARGVSGQGQVVDVAMLDGCMALAPRDMAFEAYGAGETEPGTGSLSGALPCYNTYATADGRFVTLAALEPKFWLEFCQRAGRSDLQPHHVPQDEREREATSAELAALFRTKTRDEWVALLADTDSCVGPVNTLAEAQADLQVRARGVLIAGDGGGARVRSVPLLSGSPPPALGPAPALGQHAVAVLAEAGYTGAEIAALLANGAARSNPPGAEGAPPA